jgi:hypothetical protein
LIALERNDAPAAVRLTAAAAAGVRDIQLAREREGYEPLAALVDGVAKVRTGRTDEGWARLKGIDGSSGSPRPRERWWYRALEGELALAAGDLGRAERAFAAGEPDVKMLFNLAFPETTIFASNLPFRDGRARVKIARGDRAGAVALYRTLLSSGIEQKWIAVLEPRYVLQLARLLEAEGEATAAREQYRRFTDLWNRADADLPELKEARQKR